MSLGTIVLIVLIILLLGGFSGIGGGLRRRRTRRHIDYRVDPGSARQVLSQKRIIGPASAGLLLL